MFTEQTDRSIVHETDAIVGDERLCRAMVFVMRRFWSFHLLSGRMERLQGHD